MTTPNESLLGSDISSESASSPGRITIGQQGVEYKFSPSQQLRHQQFRKWITEHCRAQNEPAYAAYYQALSATFHRMTRFGIEKNLEDLSARDILQFQIMCGTHQIEPFLGIALSRAIIQEDQEVINAVMQLPFILDFRSWYASLQQIDMNQAVEWLSQNLPPEELTSTRLILGRRYPELIQAEWISDLSEVPRILANAVCRLIATNRKDLHHDLTVFLSGNHAILLADDPDRILAPIVAVTKKSPQNVLNSWQEYCGDITLCAVGEWHLEHDDPAACLHVLRQVRFLSLEHNRAQTLRCLALIAQGMCAEASAHLADIDDHKYTKIVLIRLAIAARNLVSDVCLAETIAVCGPENTQTLISGIQELLTRKRLDLARNTCIALQRLLQSGVHFDSAVVKIIRTVVPESQVEKGFNN